jgi:small-conductance mechanosensitive channel/CRP-like cAMP-binding protein
MQFWSHLLKTAGMAGSFHWIIAGFVLAAVALAAFRPRERARVKAAGVVFSLALIALLVGSALLFFVPDDHTAYVTVRGIARFLEAVAIINLAGIFLFAVLLSALRLEAPRIMQDLLTGIAYLVVGFVVLSSSGIDLRGLVATSAVITAVIGFSLQDTLGNIMAGMAVQMDRTIRIGDWIKVGDVEGQVREIRWRQTSIETREWDTIVIPNSMLMKGTVTLLGRRADEPTQRRRWIYFNVDFRRYPTEVIQTVEKALLAIPLDGVAARPQPHCIMTAFHDSYAIYAARYWLTDLARPDPVDSMVRTHIFAALHRAGIPLSIPAQAVFVTEDDESYRARKRDEQLQRHLSAIEELSIFRSLTDEERSQLAARLKGTRFIAGETITRQDTEAHNLYMIANGDATVHVTVEGKTDHVATLHAGDYFGEMGMMTGAPRFATVMAQTDVKCYRLAKTDFEDILHRRPEIAADIAETLARRRVELEMVREEVSEEVRKERVKQTHGDVLDRIRSFFGISRSTSAAPKASTEHSKPDSSP